MNIEGTYTLQAPPGVVWQCLKDKELLLRTFPGLVRFEPAGNDAYEVALQVKSLPLNGIYHGLAHVTEHQHPHYYHVMITATSDKAQNTLSGNGGIQFSEHNGDTVVSYNGSLTLSKRGMRLPPTVVKGAAKLLVQQFFTVLSEQLRLQNAPQMVELQADHGTTIVKQAGGDIVILPRVTSESSHKERLSVSRSIARLFHLGAEDPDEEEVWAQRIRRISVVSGLLLLVLIGMRLPRRR